MSYSLRAIAGRAGAFGALRKAIAGFEAIAAGEAVKATIDRASTYLDKRIHSELARHERTGKAASTALVVGARKGIDARLQAYTLAGNFKPGSTGAPKGKPAGHLKWSFFKGFPRSALTRIGKIFAEETTKLLGTSTPSTPSGDA